MVIRVQRFNFDMNSYLQVLMNNLNMKTIKCEYLILILNASS